MADAESEWRRLTEFGLSDYQARAYAALVRLGDATASELSDASGVPQPKVYGVTKRLEELRLLQPSLGPPVRFAPLPLSGYLERVVEEHRDAARRVEEARPDLVERFSITGRSPDGGAKGHLTALKGHKNIMERIEEAASQATSSLAVAVPAEPMPGFTSRFHRLLEEHTGWETRVRIVMRVDAASMPRAVSLARFGEVRHAADDLSALAVVVDGTRAVIGHAGVGRRGQAALDIGDEPLVRFIQDAVDVLWAAAQPLESRMAELEGSPGALLDVVRTPEAGLRRLRDMVAGATKTLDIATHEMGMFQVAGLVDELRQAREAGCQIRVLAPRTESNATAAQRLAGEADVRDGELEGRFLVADDAHVMLLGTGPGTDTAFLGEEAIGSEVLVGRHLPLARLLAERFRAAWDLAS